MIMMALLLCSNVVTVFADETGYQTASDEARDRVRGSLNRYYTELKLMNDISVAELNIYESQIEGSLKIYVEDYDLKYAST